MARILVVDDSAMDRRLMGGMLEKRADLEIAYAANGVEALDTAQQWHPDLILTDLVMPEMDGFELVDRIVEIMPLVPVVIITGKGSEEVAVKALNAGAASYVPKSALHELLLETVDNVLSVARDQEFEHRLMGCIEHNDFAFVLENDASLIPALVNYLHRGIRNVGLCDESHGIRVCVALEEALNNALFHGNLEVSSELRESDVSAYRALIAERQQKTPFQQRKIYVRARITPTEGHFVIRDQGPGFDPDSLPDPTDPANLEKASGRGLLLMKTFMDEVRFNQVANEVTLIKRSTCEPSVAEVGECVG